jgi:hypothetical protein
VADYFKNYPPYFLALLRLNLLAGLLAPMLLLLKSKKAPLVMLIGWAVQAVFIILTVALRNSIEILGISMLI